MWFGLREDLVAAIINTINGPPKPPRYDEESWNKDSTLENGELSRLKPLTNHLGNYCHLGIQSIIRQPSSDRLSKQLSHHQCCLATVKHTTSKAQQLKLTEIPAVGASIVQCKAQCPILLCIEEEEDLNRALAIC